MIYFTKEDLHEIMKNHHGHLDFSYMDIVLPDNLTVYGDLYLKGSSIKELPDNLTVNGDLNLCDTNIENLPDSLCVYGNINLEGTAITELLDNLTVGGSLYLYNTPIEELPDNLTVGGSLSIANTKITKIPDNIIIGKDFYFNNTPITELPDNLVIGGDIWLSYQINLKKLPDNLVVGDSIQAYSIPHEYSFNNVTVGKQLYCYNGNSYNINHLQNGDYVEVRYLYADDILTHVSSKRTFGKYTFYKGKIPNINVIYDGVNYAHCSNFKSGVLELEFKSMKDRGSEQYEHLTVNDIVDTDYAITMYRIITGACQTGTEMFVNNVKDLKDKYSISEIIELTDGWYGSTIFKKFFTERK